MKLKNDQFSLIVCFCGISNPVAFGMLGQLFLGEVILALIGILLLIDQLISGSYPTKKSVFNQSFFLQFIFFLFVSLFGFVISDFWVNSSTTDFMRGWARLIFLILDVIALSFVSFCNRWNLWWYSLGLGVGGMLYAVMRGDLLFNWKTNYALPFSLLLLCIVPSLAKHFAPMLIGVLGLINVALDYRSLGLLCAVLAAIVWVKTGRRSKISWQKLLLPLGLSLCLLALTYYGTQEVYANRRSESNVGRFAAYQVAVQAIVESPLVGYGSWAKNDYLSNLYLKLTGGDREFGSQDRQGAELVIPSHSQVLQAWIEGGILGVSFFVLYGYRLLSGIVYLVTQYAYNPLMPLFLFSLSHSFWNFFASPFASTHRVSIAAAVAILCCLDAERSRSVTPSASPPLSNRFGSQ